MKRLGCALFILLLFGALSAPCCLATAPPRFKINALTYDLAQKWLIYKYHLQYGSDAQYAQAFRCLMTIAVLNQKQPYSPIVSIRTTEGLPEDVRAIADEGASHDPRTSPMKPGGLGMFEGIVQELSKGSPEAVYREPELYLEFDMGSRQITRSFAWKEPAWKTLPESLVTLGLPPIWLDQYVAVCALQTGLLKSQLAPPAPACKQ